MLSTELNQLKQEIIKRKELLTSYQTRLDDKDKEIKKIHDTLADRNKVHLENERSFLHDLKQKDESHQHITLRMRELETRLAEQSIKVDYLEKVRKDGH